jgi:AbiV family abortive infection protein
MREKLDGYRGKLTPAQIAEGMNAAAGNARRLAEDAASLLEMQRFPTAASLAALSIEEYGKSSILRSLALATTNEEVLGVWKEYRSHTRKNAAWLLPQLVASGARKLDDFRPLFNRDSDHPYLLDKVKQLGFYSDCLGEGHWSMPDVVIDEALARMLLRAAEVLAREGEHTEREIELWVEHIGPVWKTNPPRMKQALANWYAAMQKNGLAPEGNNQMDQFIYEGLSESGV